MSILRFDPTTSDWVILAPSRGLRPHDAAQVDAGKVAPPTSICPFCPGNEALTPPEIYSVPSTNGASQWRVRVVANKFPALKIEEQPGRHYEQEFFSFMAGCGAHEVIVESPDHLTPLAQQPVDQIECVLRTLQLRYQDLMRDRRFQTVILFKNHGIDAGTSLTHPHWQLIATPVVPRLLRLKHFEASEYFDRTGNCLYCELVAHEIAAAKRIVARNEHFVAIVPYASHSPFEIWILPLTRQASFLLVSNERILHLARILKQVLLKLHTGLNNPSFNLTIDDAPRGDEDKEYFLWHLRVVPRLTTRAGFELGSGMAINSVMPEDAAAFLNDVPIVSV